MIRHPYFLEIPWNPHSQGGLSRHYHHWWLITAVTLMAIFLIGVGVTGGTL
jgi:hypothetical protein